MAITTWVAMKQELTQGKERQKHRIGGSNYQKAEKNCKVSKYKLQPDEVDNAVQLLLGNASTDEVDSADEGYEKPERIEIDVHVLSLIQ